jgi:cytochrome c oxidase assembly protein Cox11
MVKLMFVVTVLILAAFAAAPLYQTVAKHFEDGFLKSMANHLHLNGTHSH